MSIAEKLKGLREDAYNKYHAQKIKAGLAEPRKFVLPKELKKSKMRNAACLCGSEKKFKNCCYDLCKDAGV